MHAVTWIPYILGASAAGSMLSFSSPDFAQPITMNDAAVSTPFDKNGSDGLETRTMKAMIRDIEFITQNSTLEYSGQALPDVVVVTESELQLRSHSPEAQIAANEEARPFDRVSAFYDRECNQIFLADLDSIDGPSLLHELVHFLQNINGKNKTFADHRICLEAEAYDLQAAWQIEQGVDLAQKPDYGLLMTLYGACNDSDFSWVDSADITDD